MIMESVADLIKCRDPIVTKHVINRPSKHALALNWAVLDKWCGLPLHLKGDLAGKFAIPNHYSAGLPTLKAYPGPCCNIVQGCQNPSGLYMSLCCYCDVIHEPPRSRRWCCQLEFLFEYLANAWKTVQVRSIAWDLLDYCKPCLEWAPLMIVILTCWMRSSGIDPYVLVKFNQTTVRSRFISLVPWISWLLIEMCSKHVEKPRRSLDTSCILYKPLLGPGTADDLVRPIVSFISCHVDSCSQFERHFCMQTTEL